MLYKLREVVFDTASCKILSTSKQIAKWPSGSKFTWRLADFGRSVGIFSGLSVSLSLIWTMPLGFLYCLVQHVYEANHFLRASRSPLRSKERAHSLDVIGQCAIRASNMSLAFWGTFETGRLC